MLSKLAPRTSSAYPPMGLLRRPKPLGSSRVFGHWLTALLLLAIVLVLVVSGSTGPLETSLLESWQIVSGHLVPGMSWMVDGSLSMAQDQAVWNFRIPRALLAGIAGGSLALAGALLQATVRNPLAEPYILGVSAGAGVGAVVAIVAGSTAIAGIGLNAAAFAGAACATVLVYLLAKQGGIIAPSRLILAGVALGSLLSAVTNFLTITTDAQNVYSVLFFLLGSVSAAEYPQLLLPGLGFVGLVVPHAARMAVGSDHRRMLPVTILGGVLFLMLTDLLSRTVAEPAEIPIGILTAAVGAPFFLWLMRGSGATRAGVNR